MSQFQAQTLPPMVGRRFPLVRNSYRNFWAQHDFPDTTDIGNGYTGGTDALAAESTIYRVGSGAVKMPVPTGQVQFRYYNAAQWTTFDATAGLEVEFSWYVPSENALSGSLIVGLCSGGSVDNYAVEGMNTGSTNQEPGWHRMRFRTLSLTGGSWNANDIRGWEIRGLSSTAGQYIIADQLIVRKLSSGNPVLIWRNDDGLDDVMVMAAYLEKYGYRMIIGANGNSVGTSGYCTVAQLRDLSDRGHLICNHTWSHQQWSTLTVDQCVTEARKGYDFLVKNHMQRGAGVLISPYTWQAPAGYVQELMGRCLAFSDVILSVGHQSPAYPISGTMLNLGVPNIHHDPRIIGLSNSDAAASGTFITNTVATRVGAHVLLYHHLDSGGITTANFKTAVDTAAALDAAGTIDVLTLDEYLMRCATEVY